jgi:starvation-inducible DNA-binding protein
MEAKASEQTAAILQERLVALVDLGLTLKHVHWNVVGPAFIGVHKMLDPQVEAVQAMVDATAERIATLGASPNGLAGNLVKTRSWDDYAIGRASTQAHLGALDLAYGGVVEAHREAIDKTEEIDPVTQDMLIEQSAALEQFHWFVRAHLETPDGALLTEGADSEKSAAEMAAKSM